MLPEDQLNTSNMSHHRMAFQLRDARDHTRVFRDKMNKRTTTNCLYMMVVDRNVFLILRSFVRFRIEE